MEDPTTGWLGLAEAADHVGVPVAELRRAIELRRVEAVTTHPERPGRWTVRRTTLEAWAAADLDGVGSR